MLRILIFFLVSIFFSCSSNKFASKGHFIEGVDQYFNLKNERNIWVYMDFVPRDERVNGVRTTSFYPEDKGILDFIGLGGKSVRTYFSAVPETRPRYHLIVLAHKNNKFDYSGYKRVEETKSEGYYYYYKDAEKDFRAIRHVVIPYADNKIISMVYYIDKDLNGNGSFPKLHYLASINAKELQQATPFTQSWQVFDCDQREQVQAHNLTFNKALVKKHKIIYAKLYAIYNGEKGIHYAEILTKDSRESTNLKLCPNKYKLEYYTTQGHRVGQEEFVIE